MKISFLYAWSTYITLLPTVLNVTTGSATLNSPCVEQSPNLLNNNGSINGSDEEHVPINKLDVSHLLACITYLCWSICWILVTILDPFSIQFIIAKASTILFMVISTHLLFISHISLLAYTCEISNYKCRNMITSSISPAIEIYFRAKYIAPLLILFPLASLLLFYSAFSINIDDIPTKINVSIVLNMCLYQM